MRHMLAHADLHLSAAAPAAAVDPALGELPSWRLQDLYPSATSTAFVSDMEKAGKAASDFETKWKGKLGVSSATHHMARLAAGPWGEEKTTNFVKALTKQDLILGRLGEIYNRLLLGEIAVAVSLSDSEIKSEKNKSAPVVFAEAVSPLIAPAYHAGVPKNAPHPKVAYLMAAYLTTPEAQKIWEKYAGQSSAFIPGTSAYKYVQGKQVVYMTQDQAVTVDRLAREYGKIFGFTGL